jgi:glucan biosynthesis protein C
MTLLTLPLLKKIQNRQLKFNWLKNVMKSNYGVFILVVPMIFIRIILKPIYSEYTDWADFFVYLFPFIYGFLFMSDQEFIAIAKSKMYLFLAVGIIASFTFIYLGSQSAQNVQEYLHPSFSLYHIQISILSMIIAYSWIMFFLAFFARHLNFKHSILIPANISILPIYILHQTLIIVIGYYVVHLELNVYLKFAIIALTAIPTSILLFKIIQTNNVLRFLFGLKLKPKKKIIPSGQIENSLALDK